MTAPHLQTLTGGPVSSRRLRRLSRRFTAVGVHIPPARLAQIAAGRPHSDDERFDVAFAVTALQIEREQRRATANRVQRRCVHSVVVLIATVVALGVLLCIGLTFFLLAAHGY